MSLIPKENQVKIAFLTANLPIARDLLSALKRTESVEDHSSRFKLFPASDKIRFMELCTNHKFDLFMIEEEFIDGNVAEWMGRIDKLLTLKEKGAMPPCIYITGAPRSATELRTIIGYGFKEIVVRPLDFPILLQAVHRCLPLKSILSEPQLFKMSASDSVNVAIPMMFEALSETEITIIGDRQLVVGQILGLYAEPFSDSPVGEVVAVCGASYLVAPGSGKFRTTLYLQGITPALSRSIRKWIQATSAKRKSA